MTDRTEAQIPDGEQSPDPSPESTPAPEKGHTVPIIATLGIVSMLSGFLIVLVYQFTKPIIEENQRRATEAAIFKVVPGAVSQRKFTVSDKGVFPSEHEQDGALIYAGYGPDGALLGIAARSGAQGYADIISLLYGYDHACECIRGIEILKMAETPGLGDKIKFDPEFLKNFEELDASLNEAGDALDNPIVTVKRGAKRNDWEIDAISGATISSRAVGKALNRSAQALLPKLKPRLDVLEAAKPVPSTQGQ